MTTNHNDRAERAARLVATWPPPTSEQVARVREILAPVLASSTPTGAPPLREAV